MAVRFFCFVLFVCLFFVVVVCCCFFFFGGGCCCCFVFLVTSASCAWSKVETIWSVFLLSL